MRSVCKMKLTGPQKAKPIPSKIGYFHRHYRGFFYCSNCCRWHRDKAYCLNDADKKRAISFAYYYCNNEEDYLVYEAKTGIDYLLSKRLDTSTKKL